MLLGVEKRGKGGEGRRGEEAEKTGQRGRGEEEREEEETKDEEQNGHRIDDSSLFIKGTNSFMFKPLNTYSTCM